MGESTPFNFRCLQAEKDGQCCSADPDGCRVEVKKPTFDAWMAASGDSAVNMMKTYFYGEQKASRRQMWVSEVGTRKGLGFHIRLSEISNAQPFSPDGWAGGFRV